MKKDERSSKIWKICGRKKFIWKFTREVDLNLSICVRKKITKKLKETFFINFICDLYACLFQTSHTQTSYCERDAIALIILSKAVILKINSQSKYKHTLTCKHDKCISHNIYNIYIHWMNIIIEIWNYSKKMLF